jgi:hypothetical protein
MLSLSLACSWTLVEEAARCSLLVGTPPHLSTCLRPTPTSAFTPSASERVLDGLWQGTCSATPHCSVAKQLVHHVAQCQSAQCTYPRCVAARDLLRHNMRCKDDKCVICTPLREYMQAQKVRAAPPASPDSNATFNVTRYR